MIVCDRIDGLYFQHRRITIRALRDSTCARGLVHEENEIRRSVFFRKEEFEDPCFPCAQLAIHNAAR